MTEQDSDGSSVPTLPDDPLDHVARDALRSAISTETPWNGRLLQIGGTTATTRWLVAEGHEVVRIADGESDGQSSASGVRDDLADAGVADSVTVLDADPDDLPHDDDSLDGACWLGDGLSALPTEDDRVGRVEELARVVAPDGPLFVAGIGRFGALRTELARNPETVSQSFASLADDGEFTADRLGRSEVASLPTLPYHGFRLDRFERELVEAGVVVNRALGLDGVLAGLDGLGDLSDTAVQRLSVATERVNAERSVADGALRLLAVCRVTPDGVGRGM
jgi:SAM-dependent methyltransferase